MYKLWPGQAQYMYMTILTFISRLWPWPSTYLKIISNGTSPSQGQQLCQIVLKSMHYCTSYGPDKFRRTHGCTDARMHAHTLNKKCNNYVSLTRKQARQKVFSYSNNVYFEEDEIPFKRDIHAWLFRMKLEMFFFFFDKNGCLSPTTTCAFPAVVFSKYCLVNRPP